MHLRGATSFEYVSDDLKKNCASKRKKKIIYTFIFFQMVCFYYIFLLTIHEHFLCGLSTTVAKTSLFRQHTVFQWNDLMPV